MACPKMRDDTYVNLLLAGLQLWSKQQDDYLKTRRWMIQYAVDTREKISFRHDIFQRNLLICSLTPLDDEIQGRELLRTLDRAETIRNSPGATVKHGCGPAWCAVISGMVHYRAGNDLKAIEYCDESMRLAAKQADPDPAWERTMAGFFKALALLRSGREGEARTIYRTTEEAMKRWPSADQPLLQSHDAAGSELTCWLAFKEARELIDKPSPATEK